MKDASRAIVENAIEVLVAVAVRLGVLDNHVKIGQLIVLGQIKSVQDAFNAFAVEKRGDGVPREPRSGGDGVRNEVAPAAQLHPQIGDMEGAATFILKLAVLDDGVFT